MMLRISWVVSVFLLLPALSGCAQEQPGAVPSTTRAAANLVTRVLSAPMAVDELRSARERSVVSAGPADLDELVWGNNAFAFDLYHALSDGEGNLFTLPSASPRPSR